MKPSSHIADRIIAHARGKGVDPATVKTVAGNPFLGRPKTAAKSNVLTKDGARVGQEEAAILIGKRIARIVAERFDFTIYFTDGSVVKLAGGGEGLEFLFSHNKDKDKPTTKDKP